MPTLPTELLASGLVLRAAVCFFRRSAPGLWCLRASVPGRLLAWQGPLVAFQLFALVPMIQLGDRVRQLPVRLVAEQVVAQRKPANCCHDRGPQAPPCTSTPTRW